MSAALHAPLRWLAAACAMALSAVAASGAPAVQTDSDEASLREDSVVIEGWEFEDFEVKVPRFVKLKQNRIDFNGADWSGLRHRLAMHDSIPFSLLHIGDSHLQADISTGYTRQQMQFDYGDAGRGLIVPLRLSRTNEPVDYYFKSDTPWSPLKFMSANWPRTMGFTGAALTTSGREATVTVGSRVTDTYSTFSDLTFYHLGDMKPLSVKLDDGTALTDLQVSEADGLTTLHLPRPTGSATVTFAPSAGFSLFGAFLGGNRPGMYYNVIGNNGATYASYNRVPEFARSVARTHPDLIVISLGTNEAFGNVSEPRLIDAIDRLVGSLRRNCPAARLLLVTPMESRKRVAQTALVAKVIRQYGRDNHIAVYDWFTIAGGAGAASKWIADGLYGRDQIHHTVKGYRLQGFMLYDALTAALAPDSKH